MSRLPFPRFYGCLQCKAYLSAAGETWYAACSQLAYLQHLKTFPENEGVGRTAVEKRIDNAEVREDRARVAFDLHECDNKAEQAAWVKHIQGRPVRGRYKE